MWRAVFRTRGCVRPLRNRWVAGGGRGRCRSARDDLVPLVPVVVRLGGDRGDLRGVGSRPGGASGDQNDVQPGGQLSPGWPAPMRLSVGSKASPRRIIMSY